MLEFSKVSQYYYLLAYFFSPEYKKSLSRPKLPVSKEEQDEIVKNFESPLEKCFYFLDLTSRSFAMVIRELPEGLRVPICVFYLVLRALDTIEDDMTLYIDRKREMLETFHEKLSDESYTFNESGPNEKDAVLLRHFYVVSQVYMSKSSKKAKASRFEFEKEGLTNEQREIIKDICEKMGKGMADSLRDDSILVDVTKIVSVNKNISDYNRYCYHVAGLVGIGLCKLFISPVLKASEERGEVLKILEPFLPEYHLSKGGEYSGECGDSLANSMALFLQKVNIIRDFHEDLLEGRAFWPESVTKKYSAFLHQLQDLNCVYELVMDVLQLVPDCIQFLSALSDPHIFAFCAIPQTMAIATLYKILLDPGDIYKKNIKISKEEAVLLIYKSKLDSGKFRMKTVLTLYEHYINLIGLECNKIEDHELMLKFALVVGRISKSIEAFKVKNAEVSEAFSESAGCELMGR